MHYSRHPEKKKRISISNKKKSKLKLKLIGNNISTNLNELIIDNSVKTLLTI